MTATTPVEYKLMLGQLARSGALSRRSCAPDRVLSRCRRGRLNILAAGVVLVLALGAGSAAQASAVPRSVAEPLSATGRTHHPRDNTFMKRRWGIEIQYVRQTAAGYMLEFRYKVVDAEKAKPLFERQTKPLLTHTETGAKLIVPTPAKTGALRNSNPPLAGHTYWMFFANPGKLVQPGEHVNIQIGDFLVERLVVH